MKKNHLWTIAALSFALIVVFVYLQSNQGAPAPRKPEVNAFNQKWFNAQLEDVATKKKFSLSDLKGKTIVLELMAIWCPLCLEQGDEIAKATRSVGDKAVFVSIDIDPNETSDALARYVGQYNRNWFFTVDAGGVFNDFFRLSPPATPLVVIDKNGEITIHAGSITSADKIVELINRLG